MLKSYHQTVDFKKMSIPLIAFALILFLYLTYVSFFFFFPHNEIVSDLIFKMHGVKPNRFMLNLVSVIFSFPAIFTFSNSQIIDEKTKKTLGLVGIICYILFLLSSFLPINGFSLALYIILFLVGFFSLLNWRKKVANDLKSDRRHEIESQFDQKRDKIETPYSVNIPYKYNYLGNEEVSWINIVNPFRAILVGGTPGSGKSYATIEEIMRQHTKKMFTGVIYDFKFPALTVKEYNYLSWYQKNYGDTLPKFYMINFDDIEYSHRCNPINVDSLENISDAEENTKVLMLNINKTWIEKEGDFFTDSANVFTSMLLWYLKLVTKKYDYNVCSFPHLIALSTFESTEILFLILKEYNDLKPKMKPFAEALEKGALEQLAGQVSSAGIALSKISSEELNYILTGDDFSFDLNNPLAPKILCLGNNPERQLVYGAPLGLILTKLAKTLNRKQQQQAFYILDEFPTVYVRGIDNLIATARSNKVSTVLGFQSFAQIIANYGKEISDQMIRICGTRLMGQMMDEDAELISKNIGKQKVLTRSYNYSSSDEVSENQQTAMEDIVPPERISQFSQGTFCGVVADDFAYKENNKIFYGEILPPLELKKHDENISIPKVNDFTPENINRLQQKYVDKKIDFLTQFAQVLRQKTLKEWVIIIEDTTTERNLDNYFIGNFEFDYKEFIDFSEFISFKKSFSVLLKKKKNDLKTLLTTDETHVFIEKSIRQGVINQRKKEFLTDYTQELYNDVYRIIAAEVINLNITEQIKQNKNLKKMTIPFFQRIVDSEKFKDTMIKNEYRKIIGIVDLV
jgi:hypothetical protein